MNACLISDKDSRTELSEDLRARLVGTLEEGGYRVDAFDLGRNEVSHCLGCLLCLTRHPGECVSKDIVNEIRKGADKYAATFYLTPALFGHFSSTIASAMNRGTGSHRWQVILGYGEDIDDEERSTFIDLVAKHRGEADIVHPGMDDRVDAFVSRSVHDNISICRELTRVLSEMKPHQGESSWR